MSEVLQERDALQFKLAIYLQKKEYISKTLPFHMYSVIHMAKKKKPAACRFGKSILCSEPRLVQTWGSVNTVKDNI